MKPLNLLLLFFIAFCFGSCGTRYAYFQSPLHTNTNSYKTIPLISEHEPVATYASAIFMGGGANEHWRDGIAGFIGSLHRSHNLGNFQAYYGAGGSLGNYEVNPYIISLNNNKNLNDSLINARGGDKFFGSWGAEGGINFVKPLGSGEWRLIGVAANWQQEFGRYLDFRRNLPDTAANLISRSSNYFTVAVNTEVIGKIKNGSIGFKIALVYSTRSLNRYDANRKRTTLNTPGYVSHTFQLTRGRITGFCQFNFGTYAGGSQLGLNIRVSK